MAVEKFIMKGSRPVIEKDPAAVLDYTLDFAKFLDPVQDSITSATVDARGGLVVDSVVFTAKTITAWLSGGTIRGPEDDYAPATFQFTTVNNPNRIDERTVWFDVKER